MNPRILILDYSSDRSENGHFRRWIPARMVCDTVFVSTGREIPSPEAFSHVMHTGSVTSICEPAPFLPYAEDVIRRSAKMRIPQFGVCYGHQLLCRALVGPEAVRRNPAGLEAGWTEVAQTGLEMEVPAAGRRFRVLQSHFDEVVQLPPGSRVVMEGGLSRIQGFVNRQLGLFGVQFHPEFDRETGNALFMESAELLESNGVDLANAVSMGPSIDAGHVFFEHFLHTFSRKS